MLHTECRLPEALDLAGKNGIGTSSARLRNGAEQGEPKLFVVRREVFGELDRFGQLAIEDGPDGLGVAIEALGAGVGDGAVERGGIPFG